MRETANAPLKRASVSAATGVRRTGWGSGVTTIAARQKATISTTFSVVKPDCRTLELRCVVAWIAVSATTSPTARPVSGRKGQDRREVGAEGDGRERGGGREADGGRDPPGDEARAGVVDPRQEGVLPPGARDGGAELRVRQRPAEGGDAADDPEREEREGRADVHELETEAREDTGADHVGHHDGGGGVEAVAGAARGCGGHGDDDGGVRSGWPDATRACTFCGFVRPPRTPRNHLR